MYVTMKWHVINSIVSVPFILAVIWALSIFCFGLGLPLPYMLLSDLQSVELSSGKIAIYGTMFHGIMGIILYSVIKLYGKYNQEEGNLIYYAFSILVISISLIILFTVPWEW